MHLYDLQIHAHPTETNIEHRVLVILSDYDSASMYLLFFRLKEIPALGNMFEALLEWALANMVT